MSLFLKLLVIIKPEIIPAMTMKIMPSPLSDIKKEYNKPRTTKETPLIKRRLV